MVAKAPLCFPHIFNKRSLVVFQEKEARISFLSTVFIVATLSLCVNLSFFSKLLRQIRATQVHSIYQPGACTLNIVRQPCVFLFLKKI